MLAKIRTHLEHPISIQSLVVVRIAFGLILAWDCLRYIRYDRIGRYYVDPQFNFPFLPFVHPLPEPWIHILWLGVGLFGLMVAFGAFYRFSIVALTAIFAYYFLLDRTQYLNHNYMVILYGILMCFMPANRAFSIDAWLRPEIRSQVIPRWPVSTIKLQTEIILIYAGIVKITDDWLRGEPLREWLSDAQGDVFFGFLFNYDISFVLASWGTVLLHVVGAPLLLWHRTRLAVFLIYAFFHWSNAQLFNIGIFPWITLALTTIFFAPDWPQQLARRTLGIFEALPEKPPLPESTFRLAPWGLTALAVWFAVQIVIPQRQAFFPTNVGWSGDGHRFSWRMRIYDRDSEGVFIVTGPDGDSVAINPRDAMSNRQARNVLARPDLVHSFAHKLEDYFIEQGYPDVSVRADVQVAFNGRPPQQFTDPNVDLTEVPYNIFGPDPWILPNYERAADGIVPDWVPPFPLQREEQLPQIAPAR